MPDRIHVRVERDLESLRARAVRMAELCEAILAKSLRAVRDRSPDLAAEVKHDDLAIDQLDIEIDDLVLQILAHQKLLTSSQGRASLAVLLLQDLAVVPLLALVPLLGQPELSIGIDVGIALAESLVILGLVVVVGRYFLNPVLHRVAASDNPELFTASAVLIVLGASVATEHAGLSMAMGAFLAGMLISDSSYKHQVQAEILPFRGLLLGLFFMSIQAISEGW